MERKETSAELQDFILDLEVWANQWVDEVNNVVVQHIPELFDDEAIRYLVKQYRELKTCDDKMNKGYLLSAYMYNDEVLRHKSYDLETTSQTLYILCYKRFIEKKEKK